MSDDIQATIDATTALTQQIDNLVAEANGQLKKTEQMYQNLNITPTQVGAYLNSDKISPAERAQAQKELDDFRAEIEQESLQARETAKAQQSASRVRPAVNRVRI